LEQFPLTSMQFVKNCDKAFTPRAFLRERRDEIYRGRGSGDTFVILRSRF
jgi:hypothetical protein